MGLRNDLSHLEADPINGVVITPWVEDGDHCVNCSHEIKLVNSAKMRTYWFHKHSYEINCIESEVLEISPNV